ncbi:reverse transcriptase domain-containing protein [Bradyrhizobium embrapense]
MTVEWFKPRGYRHFDAPVSSSFAEHISQAQVVERHSWLPLIHYEKRTKRYKPDQQKTIYKPRQIMYASHRDACILSKYAWELSRQLDEYYQQSGLEKHVIAYRKLGKSNYHFSADALRFARARPNCIVLCYDVSGFFDNIDHAILKDRLKRILKVPELPRDWFAVLRQVTRYSMVEKQSLADHPRFGPKLPLKSREPIATITEIIAEGVPIKSNPNKFGIPQGTPISSVFSNLYLMDLDEKLVELCRKRGALYQRYSDDILIICDAGDEAIITAAFQSQLNEHRLKLNDKFERTVFGPSNCESFQYLGFDISSDGAVIRSSSLARQWRKARRSIARTRKVGAAAVASGQASKIFTKKLRKRFYPVGVRNFSSYARRSAKAFGSRKIVRQALRLERMIDQELRDLEIT